MYELTTCVPFHTIFSSYCVPYGGWIALPIMLEMIGVVLFSVAAFSCKVRHYFCPAVCHLFLEVYRFAHTTYCTYNSTDI